MTPEAIADWAQAHAESVKNLTAPAHNHDALRYKRLSDDQILLIRSLRKQQKTQQEIANIIGCHQTTVSSWLAFFQEDTSEDARQLYDASQFSVARRVVRIAEHGEDKDALKAAAIVHRAGTAKLLDEDKQVAIGIQVVIGMPAGQGNQLLDQHPQVVDAQGVDSAAVKLSEPTLSDTAPNAQ